MSTDNLHEDVSRFRRFNRFYTRQIALLSQRLLDAIQTIENILDTKPKSPAPCLLRPHRAGDIGWIIHRHGVIYAEEYGFDETFEALVADILAKYICKHDPGRECLWIADQEGRQIGSAMI
jgi:hypothetical protein